MVRFTYVRVFGSSAPPHVLPLYIPDKLLAREIAYQTCGEGGLTKELKDKKKAIWPQFPIACGAFTIRCRSCLYRSKEYHVLTAIQIHWKASMSTSTLSGRNTIASCLHDSLTTAD